MALDVGGKSIETDEEGYLVNRDDWTDDVAKGTLARRVSPFIIAVLPGYFFRSSPLAFCSSIFFTTSAICAPASTPGIPPRWILEITVRLASGMPTEA